MTEQEEQAVRKTQWINKLLIEVAHLEDDLEKVRGDTIRVLTAEIRMLGDGLHALKKDPPKVHVMIDHAERSRDSLIALLGKLTNYKENENDTSN